MRPVKIRKYWDVIDGSLMTNWFTIWIIRWRSLCRLINTCNEPLLIDTAHTSRDVSQLCHVIYHSCVTWHEEQITYVLLSRRHCGSVTCRTYERCMIGCHFFLNKFLSSHRKRRQTRRIGQRKVGLWFGFSGGFKGLSFMPYMQCIFCNLNAFWQNLSYFVVHKQQ